MPLLTLRNAELAYGLHPLLDRAKELPDRATARDALGLPQDVPVLALFPGSREQEIARHLDDFVAVVCRETALPAARIQGERGRTSGQMRLFASVLRRGDFYAARIDRALPERKPLPRPDLVR